MVILAIVGSVRLTGNKEAEELIEQMLDKYQPDKVVSGGAKGIDSMAIEAWKKRGKDREGIDYQEFKPTVHKWGGEGGFAERNQQIADACTHLVRIVSNQTKTYGSGWTRDRAEEQGKPTENYVIEE